RNQATIVKLDRAGRHAPARSVKWQFEKCFLRISVGGNDQTEIIGRHVEQKPGRHQLGITHVIVFVFIERLEPRAIHDRILLVIVRDACRYIFAHEISRDEIGNVVAGVGTEIETWAVKWIDKSRGVADAGPTIAANFLAVIWERR